jgi:hypothetical protein
MAYLKPPAITKHVFNPLAMRLGLSGTATLVVPRRRTGEEQRIPVIPVQVGDAIHVVSTRGESDWVRNLRASRSGRLISKEGTLDFRATELPPAERAPVISAYRERAGRTVEGYWKRLPDDADHPVFRLDQ